MKRIFFLIALIFLITLISLFVFSFFNSAIQKLSSPIPTVAPIPTETIPIKNPMAQEIQLNGKTYQFYFHKITSNETLDLIPNFKEATFSASIVKKYACDFGVNGGFYTKEGGPLGLFYLDPKFYGRQIESPTFNGLLAKERNGKLSLISASTYTSSTSLDFIIQTGPIFFLKNTTNPVYVDRDFSRRHLISQDSQNNFYLFSIFEKDNAFNGPRLEDIKPIFASEEFKKIADFELLLNLDGGSASAFYDTGLQVEEFKPIGSFLCGKQKL